MKVMTIYDNLNKKKGIIPSACEKTDAPIQTIINREEKKNYVQEKVALASFSLQFVGYQLSGNGSEWMDGEIFRYFRKQVDAFVFLLEDLPLRVFFYGPCY